MNDKEIETVLCVVFTYFIRRRLIGLAQGENKAIPELSRNISEIEKAEDKDSSKKIKPHKVTFSYYDDHTWEVKGKPSRSQYDTPHVEDLHYFVSTAGDDYTVLPIN